MRLGVRIILCSYNDLKQITNGLATEYRLDASANATGHDCQTICGVQFTQDIEQCSGEMQSFLWIEPVILAHLPNTFNFFGISAGELSDGIAHRQMKATVENFARRLWIPGCHKQSLVENVVGFVRVDEHTVDIKDNCFEAHNNSI